MVKKSLGLTIFALMVVFIFVSACSKKVVLKEEAAPKDSAVTAETKPAAAPDKIALKRDEEIKIRAAKEQAEKKAALKVQAEKESALKAQAEKEKAATEEARKEAARMKAAKGLYEFTDIHFDYDKYSLMGEARTILDNHAKWLIKNKDFKITIEGNCDERGNEEYNLALGERRAKTAAKYLIDMGINPERIKTISYGEERPLDPRHDEDAWAKNRRDNFVASGK